jgi:beta-galactosidase
MIASVRSSKFTLGVCYYPEHWQEALWADDYKRMKDSGFDIIRVGEFGWALMEPEEGRYEWGLFDRALDLAHEHGLQVILGTPTATPPAWLTHKHPEVLNATIDGQLIHHGMRKHHNHSSPVYRSYCAKIVTAMAEHYRDHPAVVGWQIDNELNCESDTYYAEADHEAFRDWLIARYGTLDKLNEAWGTVFWSQIYSAWEQVHLPRRTPAFSPNPHQALDEKRFISDNAISYAKLQSDILRRLAPNHWITTNGMFGNLDNHRLTEETLDFYSYDSYPLFQLLDLPGDEQNPLLDRTTGLSLSATRDISENFCVMEQQAGPGGWTNRLELPTPAPGQMRLWTYQSIAHGADLLLYFRWRTATIGTEIYWHGLNDYHNRPNRRTSEAEAIGRELKKLGEGLVGRTYQADIAILDDYDNEWDAKLDTSYGKLRGPSKKAWYKALQHRHIPVNTMRLRPSTTLEDLQRYKVLVYPHPAILPERTAELLKAYAAQGGTIIFGARTGYKDTFGHCYMMPMPGYAGELCGIQVEDFTRIIGVVQAAKVRLLGEQGKDKETFEGRLFNEILAPVAEGASVEAVYEDSFYYDGKPALTRNSYGQGEAWYYGAAFSEPIVNALIDRLGLISPVADWCTMPLQVELAVRRSAEGEDWIFLLNYGSEEASIAIAGEAVDLLTDEALTGSSVIPPYGVRILKRRPWMRSSPPYQIKGRSNGGGYR